MSNSTSELSVLADPRAFKVYLLRLRKGGKECSYKGMTNDPHTRIRQHNRILLHGGATYTTMRCTEQDRWEFVLIVSGFTSKSHALKFEKATKGCRTRKTRKPGKAAVKQTTQEPCTHCAGCRCVRIDPALLAAATLRATKKPVKKTFTRDRDYDRSLLANAKITQSGRRVHQSVIDVLRTLSMPQWSSQSPVASTVPLTVHWIMTEEKPAENPQHPYVHTDYIREELVCVQDREWIYTSRPMENTKQHSLSDVIAAKRRKPRSKAKAAATATQVSDSECSDDEDEDSDQDSDDDISNDEQPGLVRHEGEKSRKRKASEAGLEPGAPNAR